MAFVQRSCQCLMLRVSAGPCQTDSGWRARACLSHVIAGNRASVVGPDTCFRTVGVEHIQVGEPVAPIVLGPRPLQLEVVFRFCWQVAACTSTCVFSWLCQDLYPRECSVNCSAHRVAGKLRVGKFVRGCLSVCRQAWDFDLLQVADTGGKGVDDRARFS